MAITFHQDQKYFSLVTDKTEYQIKIDSYNYCLHSYYGKKVGQDMSYLLSYEDRGFSGNPGIAKTDRTYSLDVLPQEYPVFGMGDFREAALEIEQSDGSYGIDLMYIRHEIKEEKYQ
ncbi:MAG: glycoside hydrolase family 36 N-terminal domain-containing protein, partial [Vagococcus sp.]